MWFCSYVCVLFGWWVGCVVTLVVMFVCLFRVLGCEFCCFIDVLFGVGGSFWWVVGVFCGGEVVGLGF